MDEPVAETGADAEHFRCNQQGHAERLYLLLLRFHMDSPFIIRCEDLHVIILSQNQSFSWLNPKCVY